MNTMSYVVLISIWTTYLLEVVTVRNLCLPQWPHAKGLFRWITLVENWRSQPSFVVLIWRQIFDEHNELHSSDFNLDNLSSRSCNCKESTTLLKNWRQVLGPSTWNTLPEPLALQMWRLRWLSECELCPLS